MHRSGSGRYQTYSATQKVLLIVKIIIVGAGLSGCTIARILKDKGYDIRVIEKEECIGGLCITKVHESGLKYEPYGARTFHTDKNSVRKFVTKFDEFNGYVHHKGVVINGKCLPYPLSLESIKQLPERRQIEKELSLRSKKIDTTNFETAAVSIFGPTLYRYFIENYSEKMWGKEPSQLTAEWAPKRLEFRNNGDYRLFRDQWQGLPKHGYSTWLKKMVEGIDVQLNCCEFNHFSYDLLISTAPIDALMAYQYGKLDYRSLRFDYKFNETWENDTYGTINLPQHDRYIRKCNFKVMHKQKIDGTLIQYQQPVAAKGCHVEMYPVNTPENIKRFHNYLESACHKNILPAGRLGLFKYLNMDEAIEGAFCIASLAERYLKLVPSERYAKLKRFVC